MLCGVFFGFPMSFMGHEKVQNALRLRCARRTSHGGTHWSETLQQTCASFRASFRFRGIRPSFLNSLYEATNHRGSQIMSQRASSSILITGHLCKRCKQDWRCILRCRTFSPVKNVFLDKAHGRSVAGLLYISTCVVRALAVYWDQSQRVKSHSWLLNGASRPLLAWNDLVNWKRSKETKQHAKFYVTCLPTHVFQAWCAHTVPRHVKLGMWNFYSLYTLC